MTQYTLDQLAAGIRAAQKQGNMDMARKLGQMYAEQKAAGGGATAAPALAQSTEPDTSFGSALASGLDQPLENIGITLEALGAEGIGGWLRGVTDQPENYQSAMEGLYNEGGTFYDLSYLPRAAVEQLGNFGGAVASRAGGAAVGAGVGALSTAWTGPGAAAGAAVGGVVGGFAGPAAFEAMQLLGPVALERAKNNGRETPTQEDWAYAASTAAASGALNALAPGAQGFVRRMFLEGATEGVQSTVQQTGETINTDKGLEVDFRQAGAEALAGGASAGAFDAAAAGASSVKRGYENTAAAIVDKVDDLRYDNKDYDEVDARAAERLVRAADGNMATLENVDDDVGDGTAKGAANAALRQVRSQVQEASKKLTALAKEAGLPDSSVAINTIRKIAQHQGSSLPNSYVLDLKDSFRELQDRFGDIAEVNELGMLVREHDRIAQFTSRGDRDMGGFSRFTKNADPTDSRNTHRAFASNFGMFTLGTSALAGIGANRAARWVDKKLNRRSAVKRYVDSVRYSGVQSQPTKGTPSDSVLERLKQEKAAQAAAQKLSIEMAQAQAKGQPSTSQMLAAGLDQSKAPAQAQTQLTAKQAREQKQAEDLAAKYATNRFATQKVFETGVIPENDPYFNTYRFMQEQTGLNPKQAYDTLKALEKRKIGGRSVVPKGTAERFRSDPLSFGDDVELTMAVQRAARAFANPEFVPKAPVNPEDVVKKLQATDNRPVGDRRKSKAREGERRSRNLDAELEASENALTPDQYQALFDLKESIDVAGMTRSERFKLVNEMLPLVFPDNPALVEFWRRKFTPLAAIGNDYAIERVETEVEKEKEQNLDKAVKQAAQRKEKKARRAASTPKPANEPGPPQTPEEVALKKLTGTPANIPAPPADPAEKALEKLKAPKKKPDPEPKTEAQQEREAQLPPPVDPLPVEAPKRKDFGNKLRAEVEEAIKVHETAARIANEEAETLQSYISNLPSSVDGRVEGLIYEFASDRVTLNMLADAFASRFGVPPVQAAKMVNDAVGRMESAGRVERKIEKGNAFLRYDGDFVEDENGQRVIAVGLKINDPLMQEMLTIAKSVKMYENTVSQGESPAVQFGPGVTRDGNFRAFKDIPDERADATFQPLYDFLNGLRNSTLRVNPWMMEKIELALDGTAKNQLGTVNDQLKKKRKDSKYRDDAQLRTFAQLAYQLGYGDDFGNGLLRQEWMSGANGRVYSKNGLAHTQSGDMMKGILRMPEKSKVGGEEGLKYVFHGIGNLLGFDKKSPAERRSAIFDKGMVDDLIKFSEDPFGRLTLKDRKGELTSIGKMVKDGEGFFQVLNAAKEVSDMVAFARARHPKKSKLSNSELLQDPEVRADLAQNYETDFIVQLDASNNAYQIAGMVMGYEDVLRATGLLPQPGVTDPDMVQGADIYLQPAKEIAQRIPELQALVDAGTMPDSKLRKIFKKPIGTYLYAAEFNSRKQAFAETLEDIAGDADVVGIGGTGLFEVPQPFIDGLKSSEGFLFEKPRYDADGNVTSIDRQRKRIVQQDGKWVIESKQGQNGKWKPQGRKAENADDAIKQLYEADLYLRMNNELIRDMNVRYPGMRQYLRFAGKVSEIVKGRGGDHVKVPTIDGMMLHYEFRQDPEFTAAEVEIGGNVVRLGVKSGDTKMAGRGLAAFMTHQNDAWALRETYKRMNETGGLIGFNPIHDSYGFHPSDAVRGQETWVQVMQELGSPEYNIFLNILDANGINPAEFFASFKEPSMGAEMRDFILGRKGVAPVPARSIPTALS